MEQRYFGYLFRRWHEEYARLGRRAASLFLVRDAASALSITGRRRGQRTFESIQE